VKIPSLLAKQVRNDTILGVPGVLIQLFENPQGMSDCVSLHHIRAATDRDHLALLC